MDDKSSTSLVVGIALYADHATVTVRYQNGTFRDLGLVEGREEYIKLIEKWSVPSSQHIRWVFFLINLNYSSSIYS